VGGSKSGCADRNLRAIRRHVNPAGARAARRKILAVIKSNAYGHGIVPVAARAFTRRADWFGVTCSTEGAELRESGIREPVLILTGFWAGEEQRILEHNLTPAIMRPEQLKLLEQAAARKRKGRRGPVGFHLKIDSGMNRLGIAPPEIPAFARALGDCPHLRLEGTFTHLASSEVFTTQQSIEQEKTFEAALACMRSLGLDPGIVHMANSAAIVSRPSTWHAMVRPERSCTAIISSSSRPNSTRKWKRNFRCGPCSHFARELFPFAIFRLAPAWVTTPAGRPRNRPASQSSPQATPTGCSACSRTKAA